MHISVTQEDIAQGCRAQAEICPIARAVARATGMPYVWVCGIFIAVYATAGDRDDVDNYKSKSVKYWKTPEDVKNRIILYDATGHMNPFGFELLGKKIPVPGTRFYFSQDFPAR